MLRRLWQLPWVRGAALIAAGLGLLWAALWVVFLLFVAPGMFGQ